ncbi:hypothetical protein M2333_000800 [Sphingobium sp. B11D3B]|uniref:hypothetical protein n=1 Tax=Sphingobium sp. B11D3B TaxID=2940575 RepID=UPI002226E5F6|nr:hypothetical protein [Sphingobium sp. B11D3B]MCW2387754.1 hypothetical protein [Sphingobium sp. B11D3B]
MLKTLQPSNASLFYFRVLARLHKSRRRMLGFLRLAGIARTKKAAEARNASAA